MAVDIQALYAASESLRDLRDEVVPSYQEINYVPSADEDWGADGVVGGVATIYYADDANPDCCLAHELLHLWLQANGYRRLRNGVSSFDDTPWFGELISALDNELQHHRMFPRFLEMGFNGQQFYGQSDAGVAAHLAVLLAHAEDNIRPFLLGYLTVIAPGGSLSQEQRDALRAQFHAKLGGKYSPVLTEVDAAIAEWAAAGNLNAEAAVRRIMLALQPGTLTWFAYSSPPDFPANGFFVDQEFEMD